MMETTRMKRARQVGYRQVILLIISVIYLFISPVRCNGSTNTSQRIPLYIGGIFPFSNTHPFLGSFPRTVLKAIDHVNNMAGILEDYELKMRWNWTYIEPHLGLRLLNQLTYHGPDVIMLWGPGLSKTATVVNEVAPRYNLLQFCLASSSALKDRQRFPLTVQLYYDELTLNDGMVAFVREMGWERVAIVYEDIEFFQGTYKHLSRRLVENGMHILTTEAVSDTDQMDKHVDSLIKHDARIIFTGFYHYDAIKLFCSVYKKGLYGRKYVWFRPGFFLSGWWTDEPEYESVNCTIAQIETVLKYQIAFTGNQPVDDVDLVDFAGLKPYKEQKKDLNTMLNSFDPAGAYRFFVYDILWYMALTLNMSIDPLGQLNPPKRLEDFTYQDNDMTKEMLNNAHKVDFDGMTGRMATGKDSVRFTQVFIQQDKGGRMESVMTYESQRGQLSYLNNVSFQWFGSIPPVDGVTEVFVPVKLKYITRVIIFSIAAAGTTMALVFLLINIFYRNRKAIKVSCPPLNNLIATGSICLYSSIFIMGADISSVTDSVIVYLCHLQTSFIAVGFSLLFGGLFMKTYRIHAIFFTAVQKMKRINLPDWKLLSVVFIFVLLDVLIMALWIGIGRGSIEEITLEPMLDTKEPEKEIYIVPTVKFCTSEYQLYFSIFLYAIKGILLVFGIFLAWETRNVAIAALNDSKYIAMSVYTVAITLAICIPMLLVLPYDADTQFIVLSAAIIIANSAALCLVFIPKIYIFVTCDESEIHFTTLNTDTSGNISTTAAEDNIKRLNKRLAEKKSQLKLLLEEYDNVESTLKPLKKRPEMTDEIKDA